MPHGHYGPALEGTAGADFVNVPDDIYEVFVYDVEEEANQWWKEGDSENSKWRLLWTFQLRPSEIDALPTLDGDKRYGTRFRYRTGTRISKHALAKLNPTFLSALDPEYKESVGYSSFEDMRTHVRFKPLRAHIKTNANGWANVEGVIASKAGPLSNAEWVYAGVLEGMGDDAE